jgi:hypothetical protein
MGTLGGGNVTVSAGHDIGNAGKGIVVAVGGSGRVIDGQLVQTGGGTLSISAGSGIGGGDNQFVNLRGNIGVQTGDFGSMNAANFGYNINDPRPLNLLVPYAMTSVSGGSFVPGDGVVDVRTRGDLAVGPIIDPGRVGVNQPTKASTSVGAGAGVSWFTLWTEQTAIDLFAAGGDLTTSASIPNQVPRAGTSFAPSILQATAANGSIYTAGTGLMLPSPSGQLELLARGSIIEQEAASGVLASSPSSLATPFNPGWALLQSTGTPTASGTMWSIADSNYWSDPNSLPDVAGSGVKVYSYSYDTLQNGYQGDGGYAFVFGPNNVTDDSAFGGSLMSRIYAVDGDVYGLAYGSTVNISRFVNGQSVPSVAYYAAKPVRIFAGGDIVNVTGLILQNDPTDVSMIAAQGSVIYPTFDIAGPGTFEVTAGKNIYFGATASIESIGPKVIGDTRPGASVVLQGGLGAGAPGEGQVDWTGFAKLYLDPVNLAGAGPLADQPGKVAKTYNSELLGWLKTRFGYAGSAEGALAYFLALPGEQQRVFLRMVYYAELTAGGREYNAIGGPRYGSYLRGREAIAMLFDAGDEAYGGDITLFSARIGPGANPPIKSGFVHTDFGGDIQLLAPAGGVTIGTEGLAPGADAGLITQGEGNIQIYSQDSVLLGLSRIMTTFGGDILAWSAEGDINAGRGSKTTTIFTPPKREYDNYGNIKLSPTVPSQGAGIATLNPIPDVPPGDIDLIAPLGTIDAGEAGIRVSGNVNLAALHIVNAANIQVQGTSSGIPTVQAPNIGGLTEASNTAGAAAQQAAGPKQSNNAQPSIIIVEVLGFGGGEGASPSGGDDKRKGSGQQTYNTNSPFQVVGAGSLNQTANRYLTESEKVALRQ